MNHLYLSVCLQLTSIIILVFILYEIKVSNRKESCRNNDRYMKQLIDKIDKAIVSDKLNKE